MVRVHSETFDVDIQNWYLNSISLSLPRRYIYGCGITNNCVGRWAGLFFLRTRNGGDFYFILVSKIMVVFLNHPKITEHDHLNML